MGEKTLMLSSDIIFDIIKELNMFDICKFSYTHPDIYQECNKNEIWKILYNQLFERRVITENSKHIGNVTWFNCRCTPYPGWSKIHDIVDNSKHICRNINHYTQHDYKIPQKKFKCYKTQTKRRYIYLLKNDGFINSQSNFAYKERKLQAQLQDIKYKLNECKKAKDIINL